MSKNFSLNKTNTTNFLFLTMALLNLLAFINLKFYTIFESYLIYVNFCLLIFILLMQEKISKNDKRTILYIIILLICSFFTILINSGGIGSTLLPIYGILLYTAIKKIRFNKNTIQIITISMIILNVYISINSIGYYELFLFNQDIYLNSNTIGSILMFTAIYIGLFTRKLKWKYSSFIKWGIYLVSLWAILNTQSRGAIVCLVIYVFFDEFFPKRFWRNKKFTLSLVLSIIIFGILFTLIYTHFYKQNINLVLPFTSKSLYTGRELIWSNYYIQIESNPLSLIWGLGSDINLFDGKSLNLHNSYLGILTNFGIVVFVVYYSFWFFEIKRLMESSPSNFKISLLLGFVIVLIYGYFEVSMLWVVIFIYNFMFLGLANNDYFQLQYERGNGP